MEEKVNEPGELLRLGDLGNLKFKRPVNSSYGGQ